MGPLLLSFALCLSAAVPQHVKGEWKVAGCHHQNILLIDYLYILKVTKRMDYFKDINSRAFADYEQPVLTVWKYYACDPRRTR